MFTRFEMEHLKKCPECYARLKSEDAVCYVCRTKVGKADKHGIAKKPFDWKNYSVFFLSLVVFGIYMWLWNPTFKM